MGNIDEQRHLIDLYEILIIKNLNSQSVSKEKDRIVHSNHV